MMMNFVAAVLIWCVSSKGVYEGLVPEKMPPAAIIPRKRIG